MLFLKGLDYSMVGLTTYPIVQGYYLEEFMFRFPLGVLLL